MAEPKGCGSGCACAAEKAAPVEKPAEKKAAGCGSGCACASEKTAESKSSAGGCCGGKTSTGGGCCGGKGGSGGCCQEEEEVFDPTKPLSEKLKAKLASTIATAPMMIFIKGTPSEPKCKFSKALVRYLMEQNITKFGYFDVLGDTTVREALKVYSSWKTFPQVYINSELLGGLDVVRDLGADGELLGKVPQSCLGKGLFPRIKKIIDGKPVMLFLKGNPSEPQDDDTKTVIGTLKEIVPDFGFYDVTQEPTVQNGLLQYAMQTTYPQVFAYGEHIGGLKELVARQTEGKLKDLLTKPPSATPAAVPAKAAA